MNVSLSGYTISFSSVEEVPVPLHLIRLECNVVCIYQLPTANIPTAPFSISVTGTNDFGKSNDTNCTDSNIGEL